MKQLQQQLKEEGVEHEIIEINLKPDLTKQYRRYLKVKHFKEAVVLLILNYNIWFIPIQYSF